MINFFKTVVSIELKALSSDDAHLLLESLKTVLTEKKFKDIVIEDQTIYFVRRDKIPTNSVIRKNLPWLLVGHFGEIEITPSEHSLDVRGEISVGVVAKIFFFLGLSIVVLLMIGLVLFRRTILNMFDSLQFSTIFCLLSPFCGLILGHYLSKWQFTSIIKKAAERVVARKQEAESHPD